MSHMFLMLMLPALTACGGDGVVHEVCLIVRERKICERQGYEGYLTGQSYEGRCEEIDEALPYPDDVRDKCSGMTLCQETCEAEGEGCWRRGLENGYIVAGCKEPEPIEVRIETR